MTPDKASEGNDRHREIPQSRRSCGASCGATVGDSDAGSELDNATVRRTIVHVSLVPRTSYLVLRYEGFFWACTRYDVRT